MKDLRDLKDFDDTCAPSFSRGLPASRPNVRGDVQLCDRDGGSAFIPGKAG